ncbi:MAG: hypothetical protein CL758_04930 [Chloroflexi bacterium]|nr:hypothetical protein [Chloroflexota bacterium]|tara:strand:- start:551 stop:883 length:333 start_codon:yes stop_codon:yes gene_type:complete
MSNTQININLTFPKAGVVFVIKANEPSFEITVTDSSGKDQSLNDSPYLKDWAKGYARWLVRAKVKATTNENKITGTFFDDLSPEDTLNGVKDACDMIRQRFEHYPESVLK